MKRFICSILVVFMLTCCILPCSAELTDTQKGTADTANLMALIKLAKGVPLPSGFKLEFTFANEKAKTGACGGKLLDGSGTEVTSFDVSLSSFQETSYSSDGGSVFASKTISSIFSSYSFEKAGRYYFTVSEKTPTVTDGTFTKDTSTYTLEVLVKNTDSGLEISGVTAINSEEKVKEDITSDEPRDEDGKDQGFTFVNSYTKDIGSSESPALKLTEKTIGDYADLTKEFSYTIKTSDPSESITTETLTLQKYDKSGSKVGSAVTLTIGTDLSTLTLKNGEYYLIDVMPMGLTYEIIQTTKDSKYETTLNDGEVFDESDTYTTGSLNITESITHTYVNEYSDSTVLTGVITQNAPFVILAFISIVGISFLLLIKRREKTQNMR